MGLNDFISNKYNIPHIILDNKNAIPTNAMLENDCSQPFKSFYQTTKWAHEIKGMNFVELVDKMDGINYYSDALQELYNKWGERDV